MEKPFAQARGFFIYFEIRLLLGSGAHAGIRIRHKTSGLTADNSSERTHYANKLRSMAHLKMQLVQAGSGN
ncbi:hypothetical protein WH43_13600 [Rheinheimera sp. KL1]|nr:hypothetical protein WH43_13600 [Rheinheimera sp. KL1]